ncbi:MAG: hypothetical protein ACLVLH_08580 [Eisenbergiella massiliensis]
MHPSDFCCEGRGRKRDFVSLREGSIEDMLVETKSEFEVTNSAGSGRKPIS